MITYLPRFKSKDEDGLINMELNQPIELIQAVANEFLSFVLGLVVNNIGSTTELTIEVYETLKIDDNLYKKYKLKIKK